jgi:Xaa-Pro aminopeptidase
MKLSFSKNSYHARRTELMRELSDRYPGSGNLYALIPGGFEESRSTFRQQSALWYLTGVTEPGAVALISEHATTIFIPNTPARATWVEKPLSATPEAARALGVTAVRHLGEPIRGYALRELWKSHECSELISFIKTAIADGARFATFAPDSGTHREELFVERLMREIPEFTNSLVSLIPALARVRRTKSSDELSRMREAIELTLVAHHAAAQSIAPGVRESEIVAGIEFIFAESAARPAFPSIVASGDATTILHYTSHTRTLKAGGLVVVDIGAEIDGYAADISRTYPVSGKFSARQKDVYNAVLFAQEKVIRAAKPGMWINNTEKPDQSLHHTALAALKERGYANYFSHSIGHFLGMDVHDLGDYERPLAAGDVITVEPGIYIPQEELGVRIEDDILITLNGSESLSDELVKTVHEIEELMADRDEAYDEEA